MKIHLLRFPRCAPHPGGKPNSSAFTFTELLVVLGVLCLLAALALPALASTRFRSQQTVCLNNLSRVGRAFALWGSEHGDRNPMTLAWWEGGTARPTLPPTSTPPPGSVPPTWWLLGYQNNTWFQYWYLSNELATPKILACPSDPEKWVATDFSNSTNGGFLSSALRNNAISYGLTHAFAEDGRLILVAERTLTYHLLPGWGGCRYGILINAEVPLPYPTNRLYGWREGIHQDSGGLLFTDGSVEAPDDAGLREALNRYRAGPDFPSVGFGSSTPHYLMPH